MVNRLKEDLIESGRLSRDPPKRIESYDQLDPLNGVTRPTGSEANGRVRDYAVAQMKAAGLTVSIDGLGNIFGRKEGFKVNKGLVMSGSHLDSVVDGGMFDGALGVFGAIEAIRRLNDEGFQNERPLEVVVFTGEEGSAFNPTLLVSSVVVGKISAEDALGRRNTTGQTLDEALRDIGYRGSLLRSLDDVEYFIEMHIEQGPVLDKEKIPVGVVENITGIAWVVLTVQGQENHAGTTPMDMRRDALVAAADIVAFVNRKAREMVAERKSVTRGTVGKLNVFPNGTNVVPGRVEMGIDIRDVVVENMVSLREAILSFVKETEKKHRVEIRVDLPEMHLPVKLCDNVVNAIDHSARDIGIVPKRMNSGAGHDAQNISEVVKTGMIFVPSVNGISHAPVEWTDWEDIEKGVVVLTQTLKNLSRIEKK